MSGGAVADAAGKRFEGDFVAGATIYQNQGLGIWVKNFPETKFLARGKSVTTGKAQPDFVFSEWGGLVHWIEVKSWNEPENHRYHLVTSREIRGRIKVDRGRQNQYESLIKFSSMRISAFYLVAWHHVKIGDDDTEGIDWRLYYPEVLPLFPTPKFYADTAVQFVRKDGLLVPLTLEGFPDWLAVLDRALTREPVRGSQACL